MLDFPYSRLNEIVLLYYLTAREEIIHAYAFHSYSY